MGQSNFYSAQHACYEEMGLFGTTAMLIEEDMKSVIRCRPFTIGEFCLGLDSTYRPNTLYYQCTQTASQILEEYGAENEGGATLPDQVKCALNNKQPDEEFEVVHAIEPRTYIDPNKLDKRGMAYSSCHFLYSGGEKTVLRKAGYKSMPFIAPRWSVIGTNVYGDSPGMDALGDIRQIQKMEEKKLKAIDKKVDPTMNAPASMQSQGVTQVAGGVNYTDVAAGGQVLQPSYVVTLSTAEVSQEIKDVCDRVKRLFYNDLFISLLTETKRMTATEVAQRYEEKLVMLGPVLERVQSEDHDTVIDRIFTIVNNFGALPPPPREIQGMNVSVEYVSTLAQAQRMVGTSQIEQFTGFYASLLPVAPEIKARVNTDALIKNYGDDLGLPAECLNSDEATAAAAAQQQKMMMAQQTAAIAEAGTKSVKNLAQSPVGQDKNALQTLSNR